MQQCALAGARRAAQSQKIAATDRQVHVPKHFEGPLADDVSLSDVVRFQQHTVRQVRRRMPHFYPSASGFRCFIHASTPPPVSTVLRSTPATAPPTDRSAVTRRR